MTTPCKDASVLVNRGFRVCTGWCITLTWRGGRKMTTPCKDTHVLVDGGRGGGFRVCAV